MGLFTRSADKPTRGERKAAKRAAKAARKEAEAAAARAVKDAEIAAKAAKKDTKAARKDTRAATKAAKVADAVAAREADAAATAAKVAAKAEAKAAKIEATSPKQRAEVAKKALKIEKKALKRDGRTARKAARRVSSSGSLADAGALVAAETNSREPMTAARARRLVAVGQVLLPVVAPYALTAVNSARAQWDTRRAARLGIATTQLSTFSGPGGALHARLSHVADALTKLEALPDTKSGSAAHAFVGATRPRIADLSVAVRAAEQMPTARRRAAYRAIGNELDTIESTLLGHLGVSA